MCNLLVSKMVGGGVGGLGLIYVKQPITNKLQCMNVKTNSCSKNFQEFSVKKYPQRMQYPIKLLDLKSDFLIN